MLFRRVLIGFWLALLSVTHLAAGMASGAADPTSTVVICRGHAAVTIHIDANGQEVEGWTLCPELVGTLLIGVDGGQPTSAAIAETRIAAAFVTDGAQTKGLLHHVQRSRDPPVGV